MVAETLRLPWRIAILKAERCTLRRSAFKLGESQGQGGQGGVGDVLGEEVERVVEVDDGAGLAELVDADGEGSLAEHGAEPGERVTGGIVDGHDRAPPLGL